jgi:hypothetical protein
MKALEIFVVATIAGIGLSVGVVIVFGWILLLRLWVQPVTKALILSF